MIIPSDFEPDMTFEQAVEAYVADGFTGKDARVYARVLVGPGIPGLPII